MKHTKGTEIESIEQDNENDGPSNCIFEFDPDEWEAEHNSMCVLEDDVLDSDGVWRCPHEAHAERKRCLFHLPADEISDKAVVKALRELVRGEADAIDDYESRLRFYGATFGDLNLEGLRLNAVTTHPIDLRFTHIKGDIRVANSKIDAPLWLTGGIIEGHIRATDATFDDVLFTRATICGSATFSNTMFTGEARFDRTAFRAGVAFDGAVFTERSTFEFAEFRGSADGMLLSDIDFSRTVFEGVVTFESAVYSGSATFKRAIFNAEANFEWTTFEKTTRFSFVAFRGDARYWRSTFNGDAVFSNASFQEETTFSDGRFNGAARFGSVEFNGPLRCEDLTVIKDLDLRDCKIQNLVCDIDCVDSPLVVDLSDTIIKSGCLVHPADSVVYDCTGGAIGDVSLVTKINDKNPFEYLQVLETDFEGFDFGTAKHRQHLWDADWNIHRLAKPAQEALLAETATPSQLESTYIKAKVAAKAAGDSKASAEFFRKEMLHRRHQHARRYQRAERPVVRLLAAGRWFANGLLDLTSGYGERPWRVVGVSAILIIGFTAVFYTLSPTLYETVFEYLTLSTGGFVTLFLGSTGPENIFINLLVQLEGFLGAFLIALFVFTLTRSIHR